MLLVVSCFSGVFIESPPEAAMRELKEETGIKLKLADVSSSPYVDLPQNDNLNPHKGMRFYFGVKLVLIRDCVITEITTLFHFC